MTYIISPSTIALIPQGKKTKIIEDRDTILINELTSQIITKNCYYNGSTIDGRVKGSSFLIGSYYKPPIVLNETLNIILIPTHSIRNLKCTWINLTSISHYYESGNNKVLVEFRNNRKIIINISYNIFDKQVLRATRLESAIKGRIYQKYL